MRRFLTRLAVALAVAGLPVMPASAQVPPSPDEIAAYTDLHAAAHAGDAAAIMRLVGQGKDVNGRDRQGRTPFHVAAYARRHNAMRTLMAAGADVRALDNQKYDAITMAAVANDVPTMQLAIDLGGNPRAITSPYEGTALIAAAHLGHDGIVEALIKAGAPLDHVNNLGWTALIESVVLGDGGPRHVRSAELLVKAGARRDIADRGGVTPLQHARNRGFQAMIAVLQ